MRLVNNKTSTAYVSTAATDATGMFTVNNVPAGLYTVYQGPTSTGAWTATGDAFYEVAPTNMGIFNILDYGGVGDGSAHEDAAITAAIAAAAPTHGTVFFPAGTFDFYSQILAANVRFVGAGVGATILRCRTALGAGVPAIILSSTLLGYAKRSASLSGFTLYGPGIYSLGVKTANVDGIRVDYAFLLEDMAVLQFDSGIILNSPPGHATLRNVVANQNYYNVFHAEEGGDYLIEDCDLGGAAWASLGIKGDKNLTGGQGGYTGSTIIRTHLGFSPFGIYQEAGNAVGFVTLSSFYDCRIEAIGNSSIYTENYAATTRGVFGANRFFGIGGCNYDPTYKLPGRDKDYNIKVGLSNVETWFDFGNQTPPSGTVGWLWINESYGQWYLVGSPAPAPAPTVASGHPEFFTYLGSAVTFGSKVTMGPSDVNTGAAFNLPHGGMPNTLVNGDMWTTTAGTFVRINGATKTLADLSDTQTFTAAQTHNAAVILQKDLQRSKQSPSFSATPTIDATAGELVVITLTASITSMTISNAVQGQELTFEFIQGGAGGWTVAFPSNSKTNWTPTTTAGLRNSITLWYDGTNWVQKATAVGLPA